MLILITLVNRAFKMSDWGCKFDFKSFSILSPLLFCQKVIPPLICVKHVYHPPYHSKINNIALCKKYTHIKKYRLATTCHTKITT